MKFFVRAVAGLLGAFVANGLLRAGFQQLVGSGMLERAGWSAGMLPPTNYMTAAVISAFLSSIVAGIVAALIVDRFRIRHATVYAILFTGLALWANRGTLMNDPHPYEWPLILAPLIAMPLGAWLFVYIRGKRSQRERDAGTPS